MLQLVEIPQDDSIQSSLTDLDAKLSAWFSAMSIAQQSIRDQTARTLQPESAQSVVQYVDSTSAADLAEFAEEQAQVAPESVISIRAVAKQQHEVNGSANGTVESASTPIDDVTQPATKESPKAETPNQPASPPKPRVTRGIVVPDQQPATNDTSHEISTLDDDEELLKTLDEKTIKGLHVMRRLTPTRKSMRELLAEYMSQQGEPIEQVAPGKQSWWRRKSS